VADVIVELAEAEAAEADARAEAAVAKARAVRLRVRSGEGAGESGAGESGATEGAGDSGATEGAGDSGATEGAGDSGAGEDAGESAGQIRPPRGLSRWRAVALAAAAVVIGALLALTGLMVVKHNEAAANRAQDREFLEAASEGIVALLSIDHGRAEADVQRILDLSIGAFRDDFASRAGDFITTAQKGKAVTKGAVTAAALESAGDDNAVVLVAATSQVTNVSGARDDPRPWRMSVTVSRDEDQWKMSNVEFVP
jgi:Mce-associated membrane protein